MKKVLVPAVILLMLVPVIAGCGSSSSPDEPVNKKAKSYNLRAESSGFAFGLFGQVMNEDYGENVVLSPLSAKLALAMAYNGASGETKEAMAGVLDLEGMSMEEVNEQLGNLMLSLEQADEDVLLEIANSMWANQDFELNQDFVERCREAYDAEVANLDFSDPESPATINAWVKENTHDKIEEIVGDLYPELALILINAVYFNGKWEVPFEASNTEDGDFHLLDGGTVTVPLMHRWDEFSYYEDEGLQMVSLPYGEESGGRMSMYVVLPSEGRDYGEFLEILSEAGWEEWMDKCADREGELALPRFKMEYEKELSDALKAMGMEPAFEGGFDDMLSGLGGEDLFISKVLQKTYIDVNEEGTEAAAATSVEMEATAAMPEEEPFEMIVDRPFFFAIRDNQTGAILFMGSIVDPS
ncbi:MAG: serpin family protein [Actinobacteria bacterium]|nr:serpin family protein [Actinomycetota bacterium]